MLYLSTSAGGAKGFWDLTFWEWSCLCAAAAPAAPAPLSRDELTKLMEAS